MTTQTEEALLQIPKCKTSNRGGRKLKHPWHELDAIGKSILVRGILQGSAVGSAQSYFARRGQIAKFTSRRVIEDGMYGIRIYRTA